MKSVFKKRKINAVIKIKEKIRNNLFLPGYNYAYKNDFVSESESYTIASQIAWKYYIPPNLHSIDK